MSDADERFNNQDMPQPWPVDLECGHEIWGTADDIDSGIRKHMEYCLHWNQEKE